jgi:hypothetical protein
LPPPRQSSTLLGTKNKTRGYVSYFIIIFEGTKYCNLVHFGAINQNNTNTTSSYGIQILVDMLFAVIVVLAVIQHNFQGTVTRVEIDSRPVSYSICKIVAVKANTHAQYSCIAKTLSVAAACSLDRPINEKANEKNK